MSQTKFIICSPAYLVNKGLALVLSEIKNAVVAELIESLESLQKSVARHHPDYLILDESYIEQLSHQDHNRLYKEVPGLQIIMLGSDEQAFTPRGMVQHHLGIHSNRRKVNNFLLQLMDNKGEQDHGLSPRENEIVRQVALGKTNKEIADSLFISIHTVITHRKKITTKLGIKSIAGLTVYAIINGLIAIEEVD